MLITVRKNLGDALIPAITGKRNITRCVRRRGLWFVYAV